MISLYGLIAKPLSYFVPLKKKSWVFGSDYGNMYREGSKYLIEYMIKIHPDYDCTFIAQNSKVKEELDRKGIPCVMNLSLRGIWKILRAEVGVTTQDPSDIRLLYKKKGRKFIFLSHGQPYKAAFLATSQRYKDQHESTKQSQITKLTHKITDFLTGGYQFWESEFFTSTSEFFVPYNKMLYGAKADVRILGMPRNDGLFDDKRMRKERWLSNLENKLIITYMPTHRVFGQGGASPIPFLGDLNKLNWLRENNIVLVVKQHPNTPVQETIETDVIVDVSKMGLDPQVVLYHSDVLITDYSSVWIDYIMLRRPILLYLDNKYEKEDFGVLYDIKKEAPGHICYDEDSLYYLIKKVVENYDQMVPTESQIRKYHKYVDGNSCERYFEAIVNGVD